MKLHHLPFVGLLIACVVVWMHPASAQETFTLSGTVRQGTQNGETISDNLPLSLDILNPSGEVIASYSASNDADGMFTFETVPIHEDHFYVVSTFWAGIEQSSIPLKYDEMTAEIDFPLYEVTESLSDVVASRGNLRIDFAGVNTVGVQMLLELHYANLGDQIVYQNSNTEQATAFTIELPVGSFGIAPEEPPNATALQRFDVVEQIDNLPIPGVVDTQPLIPNWPNIMRVSFFVPYQDGALIDMRFPFAVNDIGIFVPENTVSLQSELFTLSDEQETTSGKRYYIYEQDEALQGAAPFKFTLLGEPVEAKPAQRNLGTEANTDDGTSGLALLVAVGIGGIVLIGSVVIWFIRVRRTEQIDFD